MLAGLRAGPLLHTPLPRAMPAIPFSEVLRQGPGLPSDAYQPQRQVQSSGLSQRGWGAEQSQVLPWCSGIFLFQEPCPNLVRKAHSLSFSLALFLFLSLILTYTHTYTTPSITKDRKESAPIGWFPVALAE